VLKEFPKAIQTIEEASRLLAEAAEHEKSSRLFKDLTALQLERAKNEAKEADSQLEVAEEYMFTIMHVIHDSGFTINFIDSHTPALAVAKANNSELLFLSIYSMIDPL
jgi:hypothetical protein